MGIRFACHVCSKRLNIKQELAGRRGICPACSAKIRIPLEDAETSTPVDEPDARVEDEPIARAEPESRPTNGQAVASKNGSGHVEQGHVDQGGVATSEAEAPSSISSIDLIDNDPTSTWYVRPPSGGQYGPATGDVLRQWITEGRVASTSLLWREGWPQWREASEALPELVERLPDAAGSDRSPAPSAAVPEQRSNATEFGLGDSVPKDKLDSFAASTKSPTTFTGRGDVGSDRRARASQRTKYIIILAVVAVVLMFAIAYVLSR